MRMPVLVIDFGAFIGVISGAMNVALNVLPPTVATIGSILGAYYYYIQIRASKHKDK